jgi:hypothetical protein
VRTSAAFVGAVVLAAVCVIAAVGDAASPPPDRRPPSKPTVSGARETTDLRPVFRFAARDNRTTPVRIRFRCAIDTSALRPCSRTYRALRALVFGHHELRVRALDRAGNASRVATFPFTVFGRWDAVEDFPRAPHEENPGHDRYGNATWFYLYSSAKLHDPTLYRPLPEFHVMGGRNEWWSFGLQPDRSAIPPLVGTNWGQRIMVFHPDQSHYAILGWRSPYTGKVRLSLQLRFVDPALQADSNGIVWSIDRAGSTLQSQPLTPGNEGRDELTLDVNAGETFYFVIDDRGDSRSDLTAGQLTVQTLHD